MALSYIFSFILGYWTVCYSWRFCKKDCIRHVPRTIADGASLKNHNCSHVSLVSHVSLFRCAPPKLPTPNICHRFSYFWESKCPWINNKKYLATSKMMLKNIVGTHLAGSVRVYNMMSPHWVHDMPHDVILKVKWAKREETECKVCCASPYCWHSEHVVLAEGKLQQKTVV